MSYTISWGPCPKITKRRLYYLKSSLETIEKGNKTFSRCCKNKQMTTYKLADALNVSLSTIRRDLNVLETKNDIIRKYGYCIYNDQNQKDF